MTRGLAPNATEEFSGLPELALVPPGHFHETGRLGDPDAHDMDFLRIEKACLHGERQRAADLNLSIPQEPPPPNTSRNIGQQGDGVHDDSRANGFEDHGDHPEALHGVVGRDHEPWGDR